MLDNGKWIKKKVFFKNMIRKLPVDKFLPHDFPDDVLVIIIS